MKLTYHWEGEYLIPDLIAPESPHIGIWGERRRQFLRKHQKPVYDTMLMRGTLNAHLEAVDRAAEKMFDRLVTQMAEREGITESLKAENQMEWVRRMNAIRNCADEAVIRCLIAPSTNGYVNTLHMFLTVSLDKPISHTSVFL